MPQSNHIFYILNARWPTIKAHGLQVAKTCQGLVQSGAQITLLAPIRIRHKETENADPFQLYGIREKFPVVRLPSFDFVAWGLNQRSLFFVQQLLFAVMAVLWTLFRSGTIYTRDPYVASVASLFGRRVFWEAHRFPSNPKNVWYRYIFRKVAGIVVITEGLKKLFLKHGVPTARLAVIADAVDPAEFVVDHPIGEVRSELGLPLERTIVGYVGQLSTMGEDKGIGDLLAAFALIHKEREDIVLLIVGGSEGDVARYREHARTRGLSETDVLFTGHRPHKDVPRYLRAADILVMPYPWTEHYAYYMSPLKLFEYMAAGKPVIATKLPSIHEVVGSREVFFAEPSDAHSLADAIAECLNNPAEAERRVAALRELLPRHTWQARARRILDFIR